VLNEPTERAETAYDKLPTRMLEAAERAMSPDRFIEWRRRFAPNPFEDGDKRENEKFLRRVRRAPKPIWC